MHLEPHSPGLQPALAQSAMHWDIFCRVIDNYGDIGVCWRLACDLAARGHAVRLWADDPSPLTWMAPDAARTHPGVQVLSWAADEEPDATDPGDVVIEAFGCELSPNFIARMAHRYCRPAWINLEYLSAESFVERCHGLPSPVMAGPGRGLVKHFFYPGFTPQTGGLLREADLSARQSNFDRAAWRRDILARCTRANAGFTHPNSKAVDANRWVSLFCYEPTALANFLDQAWRSSTPITLLVTAGRAQAAVQKCLEAYFETLPPPFGDKYIETLLSIFYLPKLSQYEFDALLWACDLNFVRGEDSLVRAIWAGAPLVWHIYPQDDGAHHDKLAAFLDAVAASDALRAWHLAWNADASTDTTTDAKPSLDSLWDDPSINAARARLTAQDDLCSQLLSFAQALAAKQKPAKI